MARSTPWGSAQQSISIATGVSFVSTAGHGGIMVTEAAAEKYLSTAAKKRGMQYQNYLCYEEDCDADIVLHDSKFLFDKAYNGKLFDKRMPEEQFKTNMYRSLSAYNPDYLIEVGVDPEPEHYANWKARQKASELVKNKDPDFIVSASGEGATLIPGVFLVTTADNAKHYVIGESYSAQREGPGHGVLMLLSKCSVVDASQLPEMIDRLAPYVLHKQAKYLKAIADQPEINEMEIAGTKEGPRAAFNSAINSIIHSVASYYYEKTDESFLVCSARVKKSIAPLKDRLDQQFHGMAIFS